MSTPASRRQFLANSTAAVSAGALVAGLGGTGAVHASGSDKLTRTDYVTVTEPGSQVVMSAVEVKTSSRPLISCATPSQERGTSKVRHSDLRLARGWRNGIYRTICLTHLSCD